MKLVPKTVASRQRPSSKVVRTSSLIVICRHFPKNATHSQMPLSAAPDRAHPSDPCSRSSVLRQTPLSPRSEKDKKATYTETDAESRIKILILALRDRTPGHRPRKRSKAGGDGERPWSRPPARCSVGCGFESERTRAHNASAFLTRTGEGPAEYSLLARVRYRRMLTNLKLRRIDAISHKPSCRRCSEADISPMRIEHRSRGTLAPFHPRIERISRPRFFLICGGR